MNLSKQIKKATLMAITSIGFHLGYLKSEKSKNYEPISTEPKLGRLGSIDSDNLHDLDVTEQGMPEKSPTFGIMAGPRYAGQKPTSIVIGGTINQYVSDAVGNERGIIVDVRDFESKGKELFNKCGSMNYTGSLGLIIKHHDPIIMDPDMIIDPKTGETTFKKYIGSQNVAASFGVYAGIKKCFHDNEKNHPKKD